MVIFFDILIIGGLIAFSAREITQIVRIIRERIRERKNAKLQEKEVPKD